MTAAFSLVFLEAYLEHRQTYMMEFFCEIVQNNIPRE